MSRAISRTISRRTVSAILAALAALTLAACDDPTGPTTPRPVPADCLDCHTPQPWLGR